MTQEQPTKEAFAEPKEIEALFVQSAGGMAYKDGRLILEEVGPTTLLFSDRPDRVTGHVPSEDFVDSWDTGSHSRLDLRT